MLLKLQYLCMAAGLLLMAMPGFEALVFGVALSTVAYLYTKMTMPKDDWNRTHLIRFYWVGCGLLTVLSLVVGGAAVSTSDMSGVNDAINAMVAGGTPPQEAAKAAAHQFAGQSQSLLQGGSLATIVTIALYCLFQVWRGLRSL